MQFTGRSKEQVLLGVQRLRTMAPSNPPTSLGLAFELSMSLSNDTKTTISTVDMPSCPSPPIQLELLPLRPSSMMRSQAHANSLLFANGQYMASQHISNRGIDMNQIPLSPESEEEMCDYPALQLSDSMRGGAMEGGCGSPGLKREREKATEADQERVYEVSSRASDEEEGGSTRKKLRLSKEQSALLEESFKEHSTLNPKQKNALAKQLNLRPRQVEVWFQNRRARTKLKQTEVDCELLKRCCESLTEENRRLQKELQELRALKVTAPCVIAHDFYMPLPAATLTMCPSCERLATMDNRSLSSLTFSKPQLPLNFPQQQQPSAAC